MSSEKRRHSAQVRDVVVEVVERDLDVLTVEAGRQGVLAGGAAHVRVVVRRAPDGSRAPGWRSAFRTSTWESPGASAHGTTLTRVDGLTWLASKAATGDRDALASFVARSQADVWRLCAHLVEPASADDLTQEVYLRAIPALASFRGEASARSWLLAIARNTCMDELRRRTRGRALIDRLRRRADAAPTVEPDRSDVVAIDDAVASLDPDRRDAFVLTQVLGLSYVETAEVCGCEIGTIRSRVARARAQLIEQLIDDGRSSPGRGPAARVGRCQARLDSGGAACSAKRSSHWSCSAPLVARPLPSVGRRDRRRGR